MSSFFKRWTRPYIAFNGSAAGINFKTPAGFDCKLTSLCFAYTSGAGVAVKIPVLTLARDGFTILSCSGGTIPAGVTCAVGFCLIGGQNVNNTSQNITLPDVWLPAETTISLFCDGDAGDTVGAGLINGILRPQELIADWRP